jgi:RNA 2',3'-cyclic 3'-phosphodiesterase
MRLFVAVEIPQEVKTTLEGFLKPLRATAKLSWSRVDNLHITTQFIGEWPEARLDEIQRALAGVPARGAIDIRVMGIGWFPNERRPRVLWAGIEGNDGGDGLRALAGDTREALTKIGVKVEERAFTPHLTLARIREPVPLGALREAIEASPFASGFDFGAFRAGTFYLYLSAGGRYTQLAGFGLE